MIFFQEMKLGASVILHFHVILSDLGPRARDEGQGHPPSHAVLIARQLAILSEIGQNKPPFHQL